MAARSFSAVVETTGQRREVVVSLEAPNATASDLLAALGLEAPNLLVDGETIIPGDHELVEADVRAGAVLSGTTSSGRTTPPGPPTVVLDVVGGPESGDRHGLPEGTHLIGRDHPADIRFRSDAVSVVHAELDVAADGTVTVTDKASRNGTWLDDVPVTRPTVVPPGALLRTGNVELRVRTPTEDSPRLDRVGNLHTATLPFNRPPRVAPPDPVEAIDAPEPPAESTGTSPLSVFAIIGPMLMAGVMVVVLGSLRYAVFGILSPVIAIGTYFDNKRRRRKTSRKESTRFAADLATFRADLDQLAEAERAWREQVFPDTAEICRRAELPSTRLWERRSHADDFLRLRIATGPAPWSAPVRPPDRRAPHPEEVTGLIDQHQRVPRAAVPIDLSDNRSIGLVGDRQASLAVARSLVVQAAVLSGPADLVVAVFTSDTDRADWDWAKWLPHAHDPDLGTSFLAAHRDEAGSVIERLSRVDREATVLAIVDDLDLLQGRRSPLRQLLRGQFGPVAGIVLSATDDRLPAMVSDELHLHDDLGRASLVTEGRSVRVDDLLATGMHDETARRCARALARYEDPELAVVAADLPDVSRLIPLLGLESLDPEGIARRWRANGPHPPPRGPLGVTGDDIFELDLVRDGPHGLVGGTTGSGKSELLRSLVAGMAASADPDHLTFVLIDFKGGSAFEACARLPHTVGMVTDLDEHLAERALRCLEAELQHRERVLRDAGVPDLPEYLRGGHGARAPMPRLLVVIDEFATLKDELPEFIDALVGIAQRGRSLGVHMILATQRPSGAVSENIKANTNLRIALRVQDTQDSADVIGNGDAAKIPRGRHGRAYIRLGPGEVVPIQSAWSMAPPRDDTTEPVEIRPFVFGADGVGTAPLEVGDVTELDLLVDAVNGAFAASGAAPPRKPWPEPLEEHVALEDLEPPTEPEVVGFALADDPDRQRQITVGWRPDAGNLLVYGIGGSGTTTTLTTVLLRLAATRSPDDVHLYVLDLGAGELAPLAALPHTGAYVTASERERRVRLIRFLRAELDRRRELGRAGIEREPEIVVAIDSYGPFMAEFDDAVDRLLIEAFTQVVTTGAEVGIRFVVAADRAGAIQGAVAATISQRVVLRLADPHAYGTLGISGRSVPDLPAGRGFHVDTGLLSQVAVVDDVEGFASEISRRWSEATERPPVRVGTLDPVIAWDDALPGAELDGRPWRLPLAVSEASLSRLDLVVFHAEHVVVAGPARSGRTSTLATIGRLARRGGARVIGAASPRSPLPTLVELDQYVDLGELGGLEVEDTGGPVVVLVDDADTIDDPGTIPSLLGRSDVLVAVAGRSATLRKGYTHWTKTIRDARLGVLLMPDVDLDGELLGTKLPRRSPVAMVPGRGYVVNGGEPELAQIILPEPA